MEHFNDLVVLSLWHDKAQLNGLGFVELVRLLPIESCAFRLALTTPPLIPKESGDEIPPLLGLPWKKPTVRIAFSDKTFIKLDSFTINPEHPYKIARLETGSRVGQFAKNATNTGVVLAMEELPSHPLSITWDIADTDENGDYRLVKGPFTVQF